MALSLKIEEFIAGLLLVLAILSGVYIKGRMDGAAGPEATLARMKAEADVQKAHYETSVKELVATLDANRAVRDTQVEFVTKLVDRPVYRNVCLDPDGLRLANDSLTNTAARAAAKVPNAHPAR